MLQMLKNPLADEAAQYINEENEIGTLARSYTDLINFNNQYIENIRDIEGTCIESTTALAEAVQQYWCKEICSLSEDDMHQIDAIEQEYLDPAFIQSR